jgi:hypothetical protein
MQNETHSGGGSVTTAVIVAALGFISLIGAFCHFAYPDLLKF